MSQRNTALIGIGYWGKNLFRVLGQLGVLEIACDIREEVIDAIKKDYPSVKTTTDFKEVLKKPGIENIVIATPAATHYLIAKKALEAKKNVLVEKPLTLDLEEGEELAGLARKKGCILMVDHLYLYNPVTPKIKEILDRGDLGEIYYVYMNRLNLGIVRDPESALWSVAPHDISLLINFFGELPVKVEAKGAAFLKRERVDIVTAHLNFREVDAKVFVSWLNPFKERKMMIIGSKGMLIFDDLKKELKVMDYKIKKIDNNPYKSKAEKINEKNIEIGKEEPLMNMVKHFFQSIKERKEPKSGGEEAKNVLRVLDACQRSIKENGKLIEIH